MLKRREFSDNHRYTTFQHNLLHLSKKQQLFGKKIHMTMELSMNDYEISHTILHMQNSCCVSRYFDSHFVRLQCVSWVDQHTPSVVGPNSTRMASICDLPRKPCSIKKIGAYDRTASLPVRSLAFVHKQLVFVFCIVRTILKR